MTVWSHLPNAVHIERILTSFRNNPHYWGKHLDDKLVTRQTAWNELWHDLMTTGWNVSRSESLSNDCPLVYGHAWAAILALVAYDDCGSYLKLPIDQLQMLYQLTQHPAYLSLQPAVLVFAMERELAQG